MVLSRGVIFSLISILLSTFFILLFWGANASRIDTPADAAETRVVVMDRYVTSLDQYVEDTTRLLTRAALLEMTGRLQSWSINESVAAMTANISSCLATGNTTMHSTTFGCNPENESLKDRIDSFSDIAWQELGIETEYRLSRNFTVTDHVPFQIRVFFFMNYTVSDSFSRWNRSVRHDVFVDVVGLPDPLFARYGNDLDEGYRERNIIAFPKSPGAQYLGKNISDVIATRTYIPDQDRSPTYLQRLAGVLDPDEYNGSLGAGIETLLEPGMVRDFLSGHDPSLRFNVSYTANQFFRLASTLDPEWFRCGNETFGVNVSAVPGFAYPEFRLDVDHLAFYGFNNATLYNWTCS